MKISDYHQRVYLDKNKPLEKKCFAYCMDNHPDMRGGKYDMAKHVGLPSCHCSDYFYFEEDAVCFMDMTQIIKTKANMKERYSYISWDKNSEIKFFNEFIAKENILKMYGSMIVLCWFAGQCEIMKRCIDSRKKFKFFLVIYDSGKKIQKH